METFIYLYLLLRNKPCCYYSSFVFLVNVFFCWVRYEFLYGLLFLLLSITSNFFYSYGGPISFLLDKLTIFLVVLYGFLFFMAKEKRFPYVWVILGTFLATVFLYGYGYYTHTYCYGDKGNEWHSILHLISSVGHLAILFM